MKKPINTKEAAKILGVIPRRVTAMITAGRLKARKHGRDWLIEHADLEPVMVRKPGRPAKAD